MDPQEAQVHSDAKGDVAFFVNGSLVGVLAGTVLIASYATHDGPGAWYVDVLICLIPLVLSALFYTAAIGAAVRWGSAVRASIDLHRREVYDKLGVRTPANFKDERQIAYRINALLLVGDRLPDEFAAPVPDPSATTVQLPSDGSHGRTSFSLSLERTTDTPEGGSLDD